jgi:hypothetical protein
MCSGTLTDSSMSRWTLVKSRVSTWTASASPPDAIISLWTVLMVDWGEFGLGGNGCTLEASLVDLAATTTMRDQRYLLCLSRVPFAESSSPA